MKSTSKRVGNMIKGTVTDRKTGPNASDQPKPMANGGKNNQRPVRSKSRSK